MRRLNQRAHGVAPAGAEVGLYVDLVASVEVGDVIETRTGRRYGVVNVRVQERGKRRGRQHLRVIVLESDDRALSIWGARDANGLAAPRDPVIHRIRWYARGGGGVRKR